MIFSDVSKFEKSAPEQAIIHGRQTRAPAPRRTIFFRSASLVSTLAHRAADAPTTMSAPKLDFSFDFSEFSNDIASVQAQRLRDNDVITLAGVKMGFFEG
jgi:hypothetical protein